MRIYRSHVWTLHADFESRGYPRPVPLRGAAEFPRAVQYCADPADRSRAVARRAPRVRAAALGPDTRLGEGSAHIFAAVQRTRKIHLAEAVLCLGDALLPLPGP